MNHKLKILFTVLLVLVTVTVFAGCKGKKDAYTANDEKGFHVSVQYNTTNGEFATNTYILTDSYSLDGLSKNGSGKVELMLLDPNDAARAERKKATIPGAGYFLAGWYKNCTDTGKKDAEGLTVYSYSGYWDFATDVLEVTPGKSYTASEPVLTLYAGWVPYFTFEIYDLSNPNEPIEVIPIDPTDPAQKELMLSQWDKATGGLRKKELPIKEGCTFNGVYLDAEGTQKVEGASVMHSGLLDMETLQTENTVMKLYVDYVEGDFEAAFTAEQFVDGISFGRDMIIMEDLDFTDVQWSEDISLYSYDGKIIGNGHKLSNITAEIAPVNVTSEEYYYAGLFGMLEQSAVLQDLTFENVTVKIRQGESMPARPGEEIINDISIGLLAGQIEEGATLTNLRFVNCVLDLDVTVSDYDYTVGLLSATAEYTKDVQGITLQLSGAGSEKLEAEVVDGLLKLPFKTLEENPEENGDAEGEAGESVQEDPSEEEQTSEQP